MTQRTSLDSRQMDLVSARNVDLLALIGADTDLRRKSNGPHGKEYAGACPLCHQATRDGFVVQPENNPPTWFCRKCTGAANKTAIDYVAYKWGLDPRNLTREDYARIAEYLTGSRPSTTVASTPTPRPIKPPAIPPAVAWQVSALAFMTWSQEQLWSEAGESALAYLRKERGLEDRTIRRFNLGYNPQHMNRPAERWGTPNDNPNPLTLWQGIVIPWIAAGEIWAINIRQEYPKDPADKYKKVRGSRGKGVFNADDLAGVETVLWCEGELDTIRAWQEVNDVLAVASFGSASNDVPDLATFGRYITAPSYHLAIYDNDQAGQQGLAKIAKTIRRLRAVSLPDEYKDVTDYCQAGGDLYRLIEPYLPPLTEDDLARFDPQHSGNRE